MTVFFNELTARTQTEREALYQIPQIADALKGAISQKTYIAYLTEAYHHVKHTVPLMMTAGSKLSSSNEFLREALVEYSKEEIGHQEWILNDIKHAGGDDHAVRNGKPNMATELMIAYAYDYVSRVNPVGFFGMVFVLEGTSTALASNAADAIRSTLNLPKNCFSYLYSHGALDIEHMAFFEGLVNQITNPEDQQAIIHVARRIFILFGDIFRSIEHHPTN